LRLVNKFKENDFEKLDRLISYHNKYTERMEKVEGGRKNLAKMLEIEDQEELEFEIYNKKMDEGLLSL